MSLHLVPDSGGTVLDEVQFTYDDWGNPATMVQDPDSAAGTGGITRPAQTTTYTWAKNTASGGWQSMKLTGTAQPAGGTVTPSAQPSAWL